MILSILIGAAIYILLQVAFIGALDPRLLAHGPTWTNLGPAATPAPRWRRSTPPRSTPVAKIAGLAWLAVVLRIDAVISPAGTGLIYRPRRRGSASG